MFKATLCPGAYISMQNMISEENTDGLHAPPELLRVPIAVCQAQQASLQGERSAVNTISSGWETDRHSEQFAPYHSPSVTGLMSVLTLHRPQICPDLSLITTNPLLISAFLPFLPLSLSAHFLSLPISPWKKSVTGLTCVSQWTSSGTAHILSIAHILHQFYSLGLSLPSLRVKLVSTPSHYSRAKATGHICTSSSADAYTCSHVSSISEVLSSTPSLVHEQTCKSDALQTKNVTKSVNDVMLKPFAFKRVEETHHSCSADFLGTCI